MDWEKRFTDVLNTRGPWNLGSVQKKQHFVTFKAGSLETPAPCSAFLGHMLLRSQHNVDTLQERHGGVRWMDWMAQGGLHPAPLRGLADVGASVREVAMAVSP